MQVGDHAQQPLRHGDGLPRRAHEGGPRARIRWLLVDAAWQILRSKSAETAALRAWTLPIAQRRGQRLAVVALARRLAGILSARWRDDVADEAHRIRPLPPALNQRTG